jgi:membrane-associated phospholipid phosphatase
MIDVSRFWVAEWIVCAFFVYLILLAVRRPLPRRHRLRVLAVSIVCIGLSVMLSQLRPSPVLQIVREWIPGIYLMQGYWLCGFFFERPMTAVEQRLIDFDRLVFHTFRVTEFLMRGPRIVLEYFELTYLLAYPFVPVGFAVILWMGGRAEADSYWTSLLLAGFGAYGVLPWIQTRPPRTFGRRGPADARGLFFRRLNVTVLNHASVQVNTFPSGHASVTCAAALAVATVDTGLGLGFGIIAVSIVLATVLGRYHYALDSIVGVLVGVIAWWIGFHLV